MNMERVMFFPKQATESQRQSKTPNAPLHPSTTARDALSNVEGHNAQLGSWRIGRWELSRSLCLAPHRAWRGGGPAICGLLLLTLSSQPVYAQVDLTGLWRPLARNEDGSGMDGDYAGLPLNASGRARAQAWTPENFEVPEWVCRPHAWDFSFEAGAAQLRISAEIEDATQRLIALHGRLSMREQEITIWMDGRARPADYARHSWSGFATGEWEGDTLVQTSTHLKESYIRRWGPMKSDQATTRIRYKRIGTYLRATVIIYDPVYMEEPYIRTSLFWVNDPDLVLPPYPCEEATETVVERGTVPHYLPGQSLLPGQNPKLTDKFGTPYEARLGGAETMYPEYIAKMKTFPRPPEVLGEQGERGQ